MTPRRILHAILPGYGLALALLAGPLQAGTIPTGSAFLTLPAPGFSGNVSLNLAGYAWCDGVYCAAYVGIPVPHAAQLLGFEINLCDNDPTNLRATILRRPISEGEPVVVGSTATSDGTTGCGFIGVVFPSPVSVDQFLNDYVLVVEFGSLTCAAPGPPDCPDSDLRLQTARVFFRPGPGTVAPEGVTPSSISY